MHIVDNQWSELLRGYQSVVRLNNELHQEWDSELESLNDILQQTYQRKVKDWQAADQAWQDKKREQDQFFKSIHADWEKRTEPFRKAYQQKLMLWQRERNGKKFWAAFFSVSAILLGLMIIAIALFTFEPFICVGLIVPIVLGAFWLSFQNQLRDVDKRKPEDIKLEVEPHRQKSAPRPIAPSNPVQVKPVFDLVAEWWNEIEPKPGRSNYKYGDDGERILLQTLEERLPNEFVILHQLMIARKTDLDVLVLGPKGIWILESKYWTGKISCQNGRWQRTKNYFAEGGYLSTKEDSIDKPFDEQWLYEQEIIANRLGTGQTPGGYYSEMLKGGIVFTHPQVQLEIDSSCSCEYGQPADWVEKILASPVIPDFKLKDIFKIIDQFLSIGAPLDNITTSSANALADNIRAKNKNRLEIYRDQVNAWLV